MNPKTGGRGEVYTERRLSRLPDPAKGAEIGKFRPVVLLTDQKLLDVKLPHIFICPLKQPIRTGLSGLACETFNQG